VKWTEVLDELPMEVRGKLVDEIAKMAFVVRKREVTEALKAGRQVPGAVLRETEYAVVRK
jgi:hypothetical protein